MHYEAGNTAFNVLPPPSHHQFLTSTFESGGETLVLMPEPETIERAREDAREGKSPSTQAGEFVREEMEHIREGKHGARSAKQAIAIGLSKERRDGVQLPPPTKERPHDEREN